MYANSRVSQSAFLKANNQVETKKLQNRAAAVSGLDMNYAEHLQVLNYGMGGHYEPHFDHTTEGQPPFKFGNGNRIATMLFYLNDVTAGGATVFTHAQVTNFFEKQFGWLGSAAV